MVVVDKERLVVVGKDLLAVADSDSEQSVAEQTMLDSVDTSDSSAVAQRHLRVIHQEVQRRVLIQTHQLSITTILNYNFSRGIMTL